jgi:hypothetical protein
MTHQIQADVDLLRAVAEALRSFNNVLNNEHQGTVSKARALISDFFRGNFQALFEDIITTFDPRVDEITHAAEDWIGRLEALSQRLEDADDQFARRSGLNTIEFEGFTISTRPSDFYDTSIPGLRELLSQLGLLFGAGAAAINPFDLGKDFFGGLVDHPFDPKSVIDDLINKRFQKTDPAVKEFFDKLIRIPPDGGTESVSFALNGDVTVPGIIAPASVRGQLAQAAIFTRNPDGTYTLTLTSSPGAGVVGTTGGAKGSLIVGDKTYTLGAEAEASASLVGTTQVSYKFDPNKPGDLTKMMLFASSLGMPGVPNVPVAPPLYALSDNFQSAKVGLGVEGNANIAAGLLQADGSASLSAGMELKKNDLGQRELSTLMTGSTSMKVDTTASTLPLSLKEGANGSLEVRAIQNLDTGKTYAKVILDVAVDKNAQFTFKDMKDFLPQGQIANALPSSEQYQKIRVEYTLDQPYDSIKNSIFNESGPDISYITQNSHIEVKAAVSDQFSLGASGSVALPMEELGVSGLGTIGRESERTILVIDPNRPVRQ